MVELKAQVRSLKKQKCRRFTPTANAPPPHIGNLRKFASMYRARGTIGYVYTATRFGSTVVFVSDGASAFEGRRLN